MTKRIHLHTHKYIYTHQLVLNWLVPRGLPPSPRLASLPGSSPYPPGIPLEGLLEAKTLGGTQGHFRRSRAVAGRDTVSVGGFRPGFHLYCLYKIKPCNVSEPRVLICKAGAERLSGRPRGPWVGGVKPPWSSGAGGGAGCKQAMKEGRSTATLLPLTEGLFSAPTALRRAPPPFHCSSFSRPLRTDQPPPLAGRAPSFSALISQPAGSFPNMSPGSNTQRGVQWATPLSWPGPRLGDWLPPLSHAPTPSLAAVGDGGQGGVAWHSADTA